MQHVHMYEHTFVFMEIFCADKAFKKFVICLVYKFGNFVMEIAITGRLIMSRDIIE